jgi:hypothetical protein
MKTSRVVARNMYADAFWPKKAAGAASLVRETKENSGE